MLYEYCESMKTLISWRMHSVIFGNSASEQAVRTSVRLWCQNWDFMSDISYINPSKWIRLSLRMERCIVPSCYTNTEHICSYLYTQTSREWFGMHFPKFCLRFTNIGSLNSHLEKRNVCVSEPNTAYKNSSTQCMMGKTEPSLTPAISALS